MKKEADLSEFEIFETLSKKSFYQANPDIPLLSIGPRYASLTPCAQKFTGLSNGDYVVFSKRNGAQYFAIVPITSTMSGYKILDSKITKCRYIMSKTFVERGIKEGVYELMPPIHVGGIDWFELEIFNRETK